MQTPIGTHDTPRERHRTMPCNDVTEILRLSLDNNDRLVDYQLAKRTCGRGVGEISLVADWARNRSAEDLLVADVDSFLDAFPTDDEALEFLYLKHFFALRVGLSVLLGRESGSAFDPCAVESVSCGPDGTEFIGHLRVDVLVESIKGCGRCGKACGTLRDVRKSAATTAVHAH